MSTRKKLILFVLVAVVIITGVYLLVGQPDSFPLPTKTDGSLRIGIANLNFRNKKADEISENLTKSDCEIIVLLEWTEGNTNIDVLQGNGFRIVLDERQSNTNGIGVIAKRDLNVSASLMESPINGPCRMPLVAVRFECKDEKYTLFGVHVPPPFPMCKKTTVPTIRAVSSWVESGVLVEDKGVGRKGDRVIIAGDLNTLPFDKSLRLMYESGLKDVFKETKWFPGPTWALPTWFPAFFRLDYFFAPLDLGVTDTWIIGLPGSDHRGIIVDIAE